MLSTIVLTFPLIKAGFGFVYGLFIEKEIDLPQLKKDEPANFNILILGIGGGTHDGPNLTDTIILAHINQKENSVSMLSLPRDMWSPSQTAKINAAYAFGEEKGDKGIEQATTAVEEITGQEIAYTIVVDFKAFTEFIDHLDGITIGVERSFYDPQYPITGKEDDPCGHEEEELEELATAASQLEAFPCRYKAISFEKGEQEMNGEMALEYVRSRHGTNGEGSDFARSRRQQKVIEAIRNKMLSLGFILNPVKIYGALDIISSNINTDVPQDKYDDFIKLAGKMQNAKTRSAVINAEGEGENELLVAPFNLQEFGGQWVLVPRIGNENFEEIHEFTKCFFEGDNCVVTEKGVATPTPKPTRTQSR